MVCLNSVVLGSRHEQTVRGCCHIKFHVDCMFEWQSILMNNRASLPLPQPPSLLTCLRLTIYNHVVATITKSAYIGCTTAHPPTPLCLLVLPPLHLCQCQPVLQPFSGQCAAIGCLLLPAYWCSGLLLSPTHLQSPPAPAAQAEPPHCKTGHLHAALLSSLPVCHACPPGIPHSPAEMLSLARSACSLQWLAIPVRSLLRYWGGKSLNTQAALVLKHSICYTLSSSAQAICLGLKGQVHWIVAWCSSSHT